MALDFDDMRRTLEAFVRPTADHKQAQKRERILHAATELFVAHGYKKTSIDEVARAAGIAKGTVYLYYANKAELLFHAVALELLQYIAAFEPIFDASLSAIDRLRAFIAVGIVSAHKLPLLARFTGGDHEFALVLTEVDSPYFEQVSAIEIDFVSKLIDAAVDGAYPPDLLNTRASALMEMMYALVTSGRMIQTGVPLEEYARVMADALVLGTLHAPAEKLPTTLFGEMERAARASRVS